MLLFIDTNIYLRFFDSKSAEFKKLLTTLEEIKDNIYVTQQIVHEVNRNKVGVFIKSFDSYLKQMNYSKIILPEHLEKKPDSQINKWNAKSIKLYEQSKKQKQKLAKLTTKLIENINNGNDEVSKSLSNIFESPDEPGPKQLERARLRKELGNPPGKTRDPLGDELSWEQFLDKIDKEGEMWIVSQDSDYFNEYNKVQYLNPILKNDLEARNEKIEVHCFATLSEALNSFNKKRKHKITSLPKDEELDKILKEERTLNLSGSVSGSSKVTGHLSYSESNKAQNMICPYCNKEGLVGPSIKPSQYGYYSEQYWCPNCNHSYDTGIPYD